MAGNTRTLPSSVSVFLLVCFSILALPISAQVIEFLSNGLKYQVLTRQGLTLMYAPLQLTVRDFAVLQVAFSNGSSYSWSIQSTDFLYESEDGYRIRAVSEDTVIDNLFRSAGRSEVIKLQTAYEQSLFANQLIRSNNGYEQRRQSALAGGGSRGIKAAAAASTIALVRTKLNSGDSTDGAIFFDNQGKQIGPGRLIVQVAVVMDESAVPGLTAEPHLTAVFEFVLH